MAFSNYGELKTALSSFNWARDTTMLPDYVRLTHNAIMLGMRGTPLLQKTTDLTIDAYRVATPIDFQAVVRLWIDDSFDTPLQSTTPERSAYLRAYYSAGQRPEYFAIEGDTIGEYFAFAPDPGATMYTGKLLYERRIDFFADDSATNVVLTRWPNLYLYGALAEAARYSDDDGRLSKYQSLFLGALGAVTRQTRADAGAGGPMMAQSPYVI